MTFLSLLLGLAPAPWIAPGTAATLVPAPASPPQRERATDAPRTLVPPAGAVDSPAGPAVTASDTTDAEPDRWFAEDKLKHLFMSFAATSFAFGAARAAGLEGTGGRVVAGSTAAALAVGKEAYDERHEGTFSQKDLVWDAVGIVAGLLVLANAR